MIWRFTGTECNGPSCPRWQLLDNNPRTEQIAAGGQLLQRHADGKIWRYTGAASSGTAFPGWEPLDNNPRTVAIAASRTPPPRTSRSADSTERSRCRNAGARAGGTRFREPRARFFDFASVTVITRATVETFLVFHHLFVDAMGRPDDEEFRHQAWVLADLMTRQGFQPTTKDRRRLLEREKRQITAVRECLAANSVLKQLSPGQQRAVLYKRQWRWKRKPTGSFGEAYWKDLALAAGLSEDYAAAFQSFGSSCVHSGSLSVAQVREATDSEDQRWFLIGMLGIVNIAGANMICSYSSVFEGSTAFLDLDRRAAEAISEWVEIGSLAIAEVELRT